MFCFTTIVKQNLLSTHQYHKKVFDFEIALGEDRDVYTFGELQTFFTVVKDFLSYTGISWRGNEGIMRKRLAFYKIFDGFSHCELPHLALSSAEK